MGQTRVLEAIGSVVLAGAAIECAGQTFGAGCIWVLAMDSPHLDPSAAQAVNSIGNDAIITSAAGILVFSLAAGVLLLQGVGLPKWLGWVAIMIAVVVLTPAEGFGFLALVIWMVIASIFMLVRPRASGPAPSPSDLSA